MGCESSAVAHTSVPWVVYVRHGDIYAFDPVSNRTMRLTHGHPAHGFSSGFGDLAVSPDGRRVAFSGRVGHAKSSHTAIFVEPIVGGKPAVNETPGGVGGPSHNNLALSEDLGVAALNPQWVGPRHLIYVAATGASKPTAIAMEVNLSTRKFGVLPPRKIPGGPEFAVYDGVDVMMPLVVNGRYAAYQTFDHSGGCFATSDLVRGTGTHQTLLTHTPQMDEWPLDLSADGRVLALRLWISAGPHNGLCTNYGTKNTFDQELIAVSRPGHLHVVVRFPPFTTRKGSLPTIDAAWSPDGKSVAYISPDQTLLIRNLQTGKQHLVATDVSAPDW